MTLVVSASATELKLGKSQSLVQDTVFLFLSGAEPKLDPASETLSSLTFRRQRGGGEMNILGPLPTLGVPSQGCVPGGRGDLQTPR